MARKTYRGTLLKRGDRWWWRFQIGGTRHSRSFEAATRAAAVDRIDDLLAEVKAQAVAGAAGPTMSALLDEFERAYFPDVTPGTRGAYGGSIAWFRKFFVDAAGDPRAADVGKADVSRYLDWRRVHRGGRGKGPVSQRTLRKDYATLHTVFEWAREDREYVATNPVTRRLKPQRGDERQANILTADQVDRLLRACAGRPMLYLYVLVCADTAVRPGSEALWLRWEDVDFKRGTLRVVSGRDAHRTKTGKSRTLPLSDRLKAALRDHFATYRLGGGSPWVFHHVTTRRRAKAGERLAGVLHSYQNAVRRAKLGLASPPRPYDLRHTCITRWVAAGHNLALVQKAAGHSSIRTTMGYVHLVDDDVSALVASPTPPTAVNLKQQRAG
jgi:integrase